MVPAVGLCTSVCEESRSTAEYWMRTRGREGGPKRIKFQIPLTVLDSWPGMHTSSGLGRARGDLE